MSEDALWAGLDIGGSSLFVCLMSSDGHVLDEQALANDVTDLVCYLKENTDKDSIAIAIESGADGIPIARGLRTEGYQVHVLNARHVSHFLRLRHNKTDRIDAKGIANAIRLGHGVISESWVKSLEIQNIRSMLVVRNHLVKQRLSLERGIDGVLRLNGQRIGSSYSSVMLDRKCSAAMKLVYDETGLRLETHLAPMVRIAVEVRKSIEVLDRHLKKVAENDEVCRRLMTMPGVGPVCSLSFYTAVEDPSRFQKAADVGAYLGLVPLVKQSGNSSRYGRISKAGSGMTRKHLVNAASVLMQKRSVDCTLQDWAARLSARSGRKKAYTATARKMAVTLLAMWKSNSDFQAFPPRIEARFTHAEALEDNVPG